MNKRNTHWIISLVLCAVLVAGAVVSMQLFDNLDRQLIDLPDMQIPLSDGVQGNEGGLEPQAAEKAPSYAPPASEPEAPKAKAAEVVVPKEETIPTPELPQEPTPAPKPKITYGSGNATKEYDGTKLEKPGFARKGSLIAGDGELAAKNFPSITEVGKILNQPEILKRPSRGGADASQYYDITYEFGWLEVTPRKITISGVDVSFDYDGQPHSAPQTAFASTPSKGTLVSGHKIVSVDILATRTDAGSEKFVMSNAKIVDAQNNPVEHNYQITYEAGTLTVKGLGHLVLKAKDGTREYNAQVFSVSGCTVISGSLPTKGKVQVLESTSVVYGGTHANEILRYSVLDGAGKDITGGYDSINLQPGTLTITPRPLTYSGNSGTYEYDGQPHHFIGMSSQGYTGGDKGDPGDGYPSITDVGSILNEPTKRPAPPAKLKSSYEIIQYYFGTLTVTPRTIRISGKTETVVYDGLAHGANPDFCMVDRLADGDQMVSIQGDASITNVGKQPVTISNVQIENAEGKPVTHNYRIEAYDLGSITVTTRPLTIVGQAETWVYDGKVHTPSAGKYSANNLAAGQRLDSVTLSGSILHVGQTTPSVSSAVIKSGSTDVTDNYEIDYAPGVLVVTKRPLTLTGRNLQWEYDGNAHTIPADAYDCAPADTASGLAAGDTIVVAKVTSAQVKNIGEKAASALSALVIQNQQGQDVTKNYGVTFVPGSAEILRPKPKAITVSSPSVTVVYNGMEQTDATVVYQQKDLFVGDTLVATVTGGRTSVGETQKAMKVTIWRGSEEVTDQYAMNAQVGKVIVTPLNITVTGSSKAFPYTGQPQFDHQYSITPALPSTDSISSVRMESVITTEASVENGVQDLRIIAQGSGKSTTKNYAITYVPGKLTLIGGLPLTITSGSASRVYNGQPLTQAEVTVDGVLGDKDKVVAVPRGSRTNAGTGANTLELADIRVLHNNEIDVTGLYQISPVSGTLTVQKRPMTIKAGSKTFDYDGNPHSYNHFTVVSGGANDGLASGETVSSVVVTGSVVTGTADNLPSNAQVRGAGGSTTTNYTISYVKGTLSINEEAKTPITLTAASASKMYDGLSMTAPSATVTSGALRAGDSIRMSVAGEALHAGTAANNVASFSIWHGDLEVTSFYNVTLVSGELTIVKRPLTIKAASAMKEYDGLPLAEPSYTVTAGTFVAGEALSTVQVTGEQTEIGHGDNVPSNAQILNLLGQDVTGDYAITYVNGVLEVAAQLSEYEVHYYYDGVRNAEATYRGSAPMGSVVETYPGHQQAGYKLTGTDNLPMTVQDGGNVICVYYQTIVPEHEFKIEYYDVPLSGSNNALNVGETAE